MKQSLIAGPARPTARRARIIAAIWLSVFSAIASAPSWPADDDGQPQLKLPRAKLTAGMHLIDAQIASNVNTRAKGLMHRKELPGNEGMLFVFERSDQHCFWMRNTPLPLSIAFIADDGEIVNLADMAPFSEDSHCPARPVRYALEMAQGWFGKKGVKAGSKIGGLP